jgi:hypothetical protein
LSTHQPQNRDKAFAIYHVVYAHESFEHAANVLFGLVRKAQAEQPGQPRYLHLDIDGHRNAEGGFDRDMYELQSDFVLGFLMPYLSRAYMPLCQVSNPSQQRNDVPDELRIQPASDTRT